MSLFRKRTCPLCGANAAGVTFPYTTRFNNQLFTYLECGGCSSVFVDPVPDIQTLTRMYAKADYHDCHYEGEEDCAYTESARVLKRYLPHGASVLDYGCGVGAFLKALNTENLEPYGVEFDGDAAHIAGQRAGCVALSVADFLAQPNKPMFDAIHFGDVLEHLPEPAVTLRELLGYLKPGGVLYVEGPLEINPSLVCWAANFFGALKRLVRPKFIADNPPTHLFRTGAVQQRAFFYRVDSSLDLRYWQVYETGWPYSNGGLIKRAIAGLAKALGGKKIASVTFGNRFRGLFVYQIPRDGLVQPGST